MPHNTPTEYASQRRRLTAAERRASILAAARREFARAGYHGASTACIARAAGCSEPMLYKHFGCKRDLFTEALDEVSRRIEEGFDATLSAPGSLRANLLAFLPKAIADPAYVESLQLRKLAVTIVHEEPIRATLRAVEARHAERVRLAIERAKREGDVAEDVDPLHVAWTWTGLMLAGCYREALEPGGFAAMLPTIEAFIDGLR